jgi:hypothetical protein
VRFISKWLFRATDGGSKENGPVDVGTNILDTLVFQCCKWCCGVANVV